MTESLRRFTAQAQLVEKVLLPSSRTFLEFSIISLGVL